ncbi:MAG TPA: HlyD family secretion protein [Cyanothece sp. UBA12306]|nr:HlyD family secretion protein [Cyanothece sp. UBA12306]
MRNQRVVEKPWFRWILMLSAAGLLIFGGKTFIRFQSFNLSSSQTKALPTQKESLIPQAVSALGYVEPKEETINIFPSQEMEKTRVEQLLVQRGDQVKAGEIIAILDNKVRLEAALQQTKTQWQVAHSKLLQVKAGNKMGTIDAQKSRFKQTQAELEGQIISQKATIAMLEAELQGESVTQKASIERIQVELDHAQGDCLRYDSLYKEGVVSIQERDQFCLRSKTTEKSLQESQAHLRQTIDTLKSQILEAKANLRRTVTTLQRQMNEDQAMLKAVQEVRSVDVDVAQAEVDAAQAAVQKAQADLTLAYVKSPQAGQILDIHSWPGEIVGEQGIVELGQTQQMYVTAEIYETDIGRVKVGQRAKISGKGVIDNIEGTVDEIGLSIKTKDILGTDPVADADARVVSVRIRLDSQASQQVKALTNLQVNVVIQTSS